MTPSKKIIHGLVGTVAGWIIIWALNLIVSYTFFLADISIKIFSPIGISIAIAGIIVATLPYWFLRSRYPYIASGILVGICLTVSVVLLLLSFSEI